MTPPDLAPPPDKAPSGGPTRRRVLAGGLAAAGAAAAGGAWVGRATAGDSGTGSSSSSPGDPDHPGAGGVGGAGETSHPFRGEHQQGITTPAQQQMHMTAFDLTTDDRDELIALLTDWTAAAEAMTAGRQIGADRLAYSMPPDDTGETLDLGPAALTVTVGFGRSLFDDEGRDRFGLADKMPAALAEPIPRMAAEKLDPARGGGDLVVQACAEDPLVALHAIHNLTRIGFGRATVRWTQLGYGRTSSTGAGQATPRNLFGFKDGTASLRGDADADLRDFVWVADGDDPAAEWMTGGTYMCARKIRMAMEVWDELSLRAQEESIGRDKLHGAPLSGGEESTEPDFSARGRSGEPAIPERSHVAMMHPSRNGGVRMLRRGYNYTDGSDALGRLDAGLFFIAFVRDPRTHFTPLLARMRTDLLTEYLQHVASAVFAIPPGLREGETYLGQRLFEA